MAKLKGIDISTLPPGLRMRYISLAASHGRRTCSRVSRQTTVPMLSGAKRLNSRFSTLSTPGPFSRSQPMYSFPGKNRRRSANPSCPSTWNAPNSTTGSMKSRPDVTLPNHCRTTLFTPLTSQEPRV